MVSDFFDNLDEYEGCLNPCCNGIWSQTVMLEDKGLQAGLNPCCNGIWSQTYLCHYYHEFETS